MLPSHHGDWHAVLNKFPHIPALPDESDEGYIARMNRVFDDFWARLRGREPGVQESRNGQRI